MVGWWNNTYALFVHFLDRTATPGESGAVAGLCIFLGALALSNTATALGAVRAFYKTSVLLTVQGLFLLVAALAIPESFGFHVAWLPLAVAGVMLLCVEVPLTKHVLKGRYIPILIAWIVTLLTVGAILSLEPLMIEKFKRFDQSIQSKKQRIEMERYNYGTDFRH